MKFIKNIGNASTTASLDGRKLGHNVNASVYKKDGKFIVTLETNGAPVKGVSLEVFDSEAEYEKWEDSCPEGKALMLHGLHLFNCTTSFDRSEDEQTQECSDYDLDKWRY